MKKNLFLKGIVALFSLTLITGCSNTKKAEPNAKSDQTTATEKSTSKTSETSSETKPSTTSAESSLRSSESTSNSTSSSTSSVETTLSTEAQPVNNEPYAVDLAEISAPTSFQFRGMNVPQSVALDSSSGTVTFNGKDGSAATYAAQFETVPTESIRVFSYNGNAIRTVNVNTKVNVLEQLSGGQGQAVTGPLYVFTNSGGGLSVATPNYAGNVEPDQTDVMLEAVQ